MKKAITILAICSLLLTACGQIDETENIKLAFDM